MRNQGLESKILYVGVDESNHGRDNEIFVSAHSTLKSDTIEGKYPKLRGKASGKKAYLLSNFSQRDYLLVLLQKEVSNRIKPYKLIGTIIVSLIQDIQHEDFERIHLLLDGEWTLNKQLYIKDISSDLLNMPKDKMKIDCGSGYDQKYFIVNLADALANYLFRCTYADLSVNKNRKELIGF